MVEIIKTIDGTYLPVIGRYIELFVYKDFHKFIGKDGRFKSRYIRKFRRMLVRLNYNNYYRFINSKGLYTLKKIS